MTTPDRPELMLTEGAERTLVEAIAGEAATNPSGVINMIDGIRLLIEAQRRSAEQEAADVSEAQAILHRVDRELAVEEALTRELMARHGL